MKKLLRRALLSLGLLPTALFADTLTPTDPKPYKGQVFVTGSYGTFGNSYSEADLLYPLWQRIDRAFLGDIRFVKGENQSREWNLGLAYRWLSPSGKHLFGVYEFYDIKNSDLGNTFEQLTLGGEFKTENWTARGNYYLPTSTTEYRDTSTNAFQLRPIGSGSPYQNLYVSYGYERAVGGFDIEAGRTVPQVPGLTGYAGYFYFSNSNLSEDITGPRFRAEYQLGALNLPQKWLKNLQLEAAWQNDAVRGTIFNLGMKLTIPLSRTIATPTGLNARMMDYIRRDTNVVTVTSDNNFDLYRDSQGRAPSVAVVDSASGINNAAADNVGIIVVQNDIDVTAPVTLGDDTTLTGGQFEYAPGLFFNLSGNATPATLTNTIEDTDLIIVGQNNTIQDLNLAVTLSENASSYPHVIINPITVITPTGQDPIIIGSSVGTLTVNNVTLTNGNIFVLLSDGSQNSDIRLSNNSVTLPTLSSTTVSINPLSFNGAIVIRMSSSTSSTVNVSGNTIEIGSGNTLPSKAYGIYLASAAVSLNDTSQMAITGLENNSIYIKGTTTDAESITLAGIALLNTGTTQTITGNISNNKFTVGDISLSGPTTKDLDIKGIWIGNGGTQKITGNIDNNNIAIGNIILEGGEGKNPIAATLKGIAITGIKDGLQNATLTFTGNINDNTIDIGETEITGPTFIKTETSEEPVTVSLDFQGIVVEAEETTQNFTGELSYNEITIGDATVTGGSITIENPEVTGEVVTESTLEGIVLKNTEGSQTLNFSDFSHNDIEFGNLETIGGSAIGDNATSKAGLTVRGIAVINKNTSANDILQLIRGDFNNNTVNTGTMGISTGSTTVSDGNNSADIVFEGIVLRNESGQGSAVQGFLGNLQDNLINTGAIVKVASTTDLGTNATVSGIFLSNDTGTQEFTGNIADNSIALESNTGGDATGIVLQNNAGEMIFDGNIVDNVIELGDTSGGTSTGIFLQNDLSSTQDITGNINTNTITIGNLSEGATGTGLNITNAMGAQTITGNISNTITFGNITDSTAKGITVDNSASANDGTQTLTGDMTENEISFGNVSVTTGESTVYGLSFSNGNYGAIATQTVEGNLSNNTVTFNQTTTPTSDIILKGFYFENETGNTVPATQSVTQGFYGNTVTAPSYLSSRYVFNNVGTTPGTITIVIGNGATTGTPEQLLEEFSTQNNTTSDNVQLEGNTNNITFAAEAE